MNAAAPSLVELDDGVFAYLQPAGGWCVSNAGLIRGGQQSLLVDTAATELRTRALRRHVLAVAPAGPDVLVNTHFHGDHVFGNDQFSPQALVVGHEQMRTEMAQAGFGLRSLWPDVDWGACRLVLPQVTFSDRLTFELGDMQVELHHVGPAHTAGDVVVWLPAQRILFAGDVLMSGATPFCLMGSVQGSLRAIARLRTFNPRIVVAGHGPAGGPEVLDTNERYLNWICELAETGRAAGLTPMQTARQSTLGVFADLLDSERLVGNLHRAYADLDPRPQPAAVNIGVAFGEMIAYHGRLPDCHA